MKKKLRRPATAEGIERLEVAGSGAAVSWREAGKCAELVWSAGMFLRDWPREFHQDFLSLGPSPRRGDGRGRGAEREFELNIQDAKCNRGSGSVGGRKELHWIDARLA